MYEMALSRKNPGCIIFLLDRSDSMAQPWAGGETLAEGAARAINDILMELCLRAQKEPGLSRHYFDIGIFGYGTRPMSGGEGVESAFSGKLAGRDLVPLPELRDNPIAVRQTTSVDVGGPPAMVPVWIEPMHGYRTPMCEAVAVAGQHAFDWAQAHPGSFPPIIINITDGIVTDSPYGGASLHEWAQRLTGISTQDGSALLFNIFLSTAQGGVMFPASEGGLPPPGPGLFQMSSVLPPPMVANATAAEVVVPPGAKGFAFNADPPMLVKFLEIGTRVQARDY
jgi:hypothetical protein